MIPILETDNQEINMAYRLAIGDFFSNIAPFCDGLLCEKKPVMLAGMGYDTPWTRDAAINTWNGGGLLAPDVAKNTLLSVVIVENGKKRIGGEYWDAIIWAIGAYQLWLFTGDQEFHVLASDVIVNSLRYFEETEFNEELNLFRGGSCYGDGISAYPDAYTTGESGFISFADKRPELCIDRGVGIPIYTLSTNCLYFQAYRIAYQMTKNSEFLNKAEKMKESINRHFWNEETGLYDYIVDSFGGCSSQEGLGESFAILFGIADARQISRILKNMVVTTNGIPCLYPNFARYEKYGLGRHCGTVWPHVQVFWADAVSKFDADKFEHELMALTHNVLRDGYFSEIYHPETGERYGGVQEWRGNYTDTWKSEKRQMWCATGYIRMILFDLIGIRFEEDGIHICPNATKCVNKISLYGLKYRNMIIDIVIGDKVGRNKEIVIPSSQSGHIKVSLNANKAPQNGLERVVEK